MTDLLPLFPLGTVLFPGAELALHVFEERYLEMMRDLVASADRRWFGVVAIKRGHEVGDAAPELYGVGCIAVVRRIDAYPDGRYDLVAVGGPRFTMDAVDTSGPYLRATATLIREEEGAGGDAAAGLTALASYRDALRSAGVPSAPSPETGADVLSVSYAAAAALQVDVAERQALLECGTAADRLAAALALLRRETTLVRALRVVQPGRESTLGPVSLN